MEKHLFCLSFLLIIYVTAGTIVQQKVFVQTKDKSAYLYKPNMPAMTEFTHCMWHEIERNNVHCYQMSISSATPGGNNRDNHYFAGFESLTTTSRKHTFAGHDDTGTPYTYTPVNETFLEVVYSGWHKYCYVNRKMSNNQWLLKGYMDIDTPGILQEFVSSTSIVEQIFSGSKIALACDQDGVSSDPATVVISSTNDQCYSQISMFNMWDYSMSLDELNSIGCKDQGNVVNMDNLEEHGDVRFIYGEFECPDIPERVDTHGMFCKRHNTTLNGSTFENVTTTSLHDCVKECSYNRVCESANYRKFDSLCQLNSASEIDETLLHESGVVHLSPYSCM